MDQPNSNLTKHNAPKQSDNDALHFKMFRLFIYIYIFFFFWFAVVELFYDT